MILPRSGAGLPAWRRQVASWLMGALRLGIAWLVARDPVYALTGDALVGTMPAAARWSAAIAIVVGALLFAWSRTVLVGFVLLAAGLGAFQYAWQKVGFTGGTTFVRTLALLAVLAAGELLVRRLQKRLYS